MPVGGVCYYSSDKNYFKYTEITRITKSASMSAEIQKDKARDRKPVYGMRCTG
jgi:hypothetical protein